MYQSYDDDNNDEDLISDINIVPFVDILLVILIIFMVTAPIVLRPSLKIKLPEAQSGDKSEPTSFQLVISSEEVIFLNDKKVEFSQLTSLAKRFVLQNPEGQAIISADQGVSHGHVVSILDQIKMGGVKRLGLGIEKSKLEGLLPKNPPKSP